ncbi:MAG: hypothetical protein ACREI1_02615 [Nitrospiraceae bacterium]
MSRYEMLQTELGGLKVRQVLAVMTPALAAAILSVPAADSGAARLVTAVVTLVVLPLVLHRVWCLIFPTYRG